MPDEEPVSLDAAELTANARRHYGADGRLALPDMSDWDIFPFEGQLLVKPLADPVLPEPPRHGEDSRECNACAAADSDYAWTNKHWRLKAPAPQPVPTFLLEPRSHVDLGDLDEALAAELGTLTVRIERAVASIPGVARVHVNRWGDGGAHLHIWFFGRPAGMLQLRGSCLPDWLDVLPAIPDDQWRRLAKCVADTLALRT